MQRRRSNQPSDVGACPSNVIDLSQFRNRNQALHSIFYLTDSDQYLDNLNALNLLQVTSIHSKDELRSKMIQHNPELVIVESDLRWVSCVKAIEEADYLLEVPIVLVVDPKTLKAQPNLVKDAYTSGVHDVLFAPFDQEELLEALKVLLKFHQTARSL